VLIFLALAAAEGAALLLGRVAARAIPFALHVPDEDAFTKGLDNYQKRRDPELGWPAPASLGGDVFDAEGKRPSPSSPPGPPCVALYGDSFTFAGEVPHGEAWGDVLAGMLGCAVANYGVSGYGTDQALLRSRRHPAPQARVAILGIYPENVLRNLNQYRVFIGGSAFSFKPRFVLEQDALRLIPLPKLSAEGVAEFHRRPETLLPHETFLPDSRWGPARLDFPHALALGRALFHPRVWAALAGKTSWGAFLKPDHPAGGHALTVAIAQTFAEEARARGQKALMVLFPTQSAHRRFEKEGHWAHRPLAEAMENAGLHVLDVSPDFAERAKSLQGGFCDLLTFPETCRGHYNAAGYRLVAEAVHRAIEPATFRAQTNPEGAPPRRSEDAQTDR
jgi:hypothetical protein